MKRAAIYVRVSSQEQKKHGLSVDNQLDALNTYCKENKYSIAGTYNDAGISARKKYTKRPALLQLMQDCEAGKVDIVLFTKLDRWFRSVGDYYEVQRVLDKCHVPWRAIWEDYETETSAGIFKVNIMLSVAQSEADRTSERIKAVNEYRRAQGIYTSGKVATGYKLKKGCVYKDPEKREGIDAFFMTYDKTLSVPIAMNKAREKGVYFTRQTGTRMLLNPAYTGSSYGATFEPYITVEQWQKNVDSIHNKSCRKTKEQKHIYFFTGLIKCSCCNGATAGKTRYLKSGNVVKPYKYYRCSRAVNMVCSNKISVSERRIERYMLENIEYFIERYNMDISSNADTSVDYSQDIKNLNGKLKRIGDRYEDGDISRAEYKSKRESILRQIETLNLQYQPKKTPKTLPENWKEVYQTLDDFHKREFWVQIVNRMELRHDGTVDVFI